MNRDRIRLVADRIRSQPFGDEDAASGFNMCPVAFHANGAPADIVGFTLALQGGFNDDTDDVACSIGTVRPWILARRFLGLTQDEASALFVPMTDNYWFWDLPGDACYISPDRAATVLDHLAETGVVNWDVLNATDELS